MENKKGIVILVGVLFVITLALGGLGLFQSIKNSNKPIEKPKEYTVNVLYYLDDVEVTSIPGGGQSSNDEQKYSYQTFVCTNNVKGVWDEANWTFTPNKTADATCKVYFVSKFVDVNINVIGGTSKTVKSNTIERANNFEIEIKPTTGYVYSSTKCTNNEVAVWDTATNKLTVQSVNKNTTCEVTFLIGKHKAEIKVTNGTGATTIEDKDYGGAVTSTITANSGYGTPSISCTNNQSANWSEGTFKIAKLTNDTVCTVTFKLLPVTPTSYTVKLIVGTHGKIDGTTKREVTKTIDSGGTAYFTVDYDEGYEAGTISGCTTATESIGIVSVTNVTSNLTCTMSIQAKS